MRVNRIFVHRSLVAIFINLLDFLVSAHQKQGKKPLNSLQFIEQLLYKSDYQNHFDALFRVSLNHLQEERLELTHKESQIVCWIEFAPNFVSSETITDWIEHEPLCEY